MDDLESGTEMPVQLGTVWEDAAEFQEYVDQAKQLGLDTHAAIGPVLRTDFFMCKLAKGQFAVSVPAFCREHDTLCRVVFETRKGSRIFEVPLWYLRSWLIDAGLKT